MNNTAIQTKTEDLGERLKRLRKAKRIPAAEMARMIGVAPTTYREWERGRGLKLPPFKRISQILAISVTELITGQRDHSPQCLEVLQVIETLAREERLKLLAVT